jgi:hypothetical protein
MSVDVVGDARWFRDDRVEIVVFATPVIIIRWQGLRTALTKSLYQTCNGDEQRKGRRSSRILEKRRQQIDLDYVSSMVEDIGGHNVR